MKTHWKKEFNYDYLGSYSLPEGRDIVLTIKETKKEKVVGQNGKKEECFVCYFTESEKPMILNRTNCKTIEKIVGSPYIEEWLSVRVKIGIDRVNAFGESVDALRIRPVKMASIESINIASELLNKAKIDDKDRATINARLASFTVDDINKAVEYLRGKQ